MASNSIITVDQEWRGSHTNKAGHPVMGDVHIVVYGQTCDQLVNKLLSRPMSKYVEYKNIWKGDKNATTGFMYLYVTDSEQVIYSNEHSQNGKPWTGTVTCHITAKFEVMRIG